MIEIIVQEYLAEQLSVPVVLSHETGLPDSYVIIEKTSSTKVDQVKSATFAFQSYAPSLYEAVKLNELVKSAVESLIELNEISGVHFNSDYNYTDTETKQYRYQAVFDIGFF